MSPLAAAALFLILSPGLHAETPKEEARIAYDRGLSAVRIADWDLANDYFLEALKKGGPTPPLLKSLGMTRVHAKQPLVAMAWLYAYLEAAPDAPDRKKIESRILDMDVRAVSLIRNIMRDALKQVKRLSKEDLHVIGADQDDTIVLSLILRAVASTGDERRTKEVSALLPASTRKDQLRKRYLAEYHYNGGDYKKAYDLLYDAGFARGTYEFPWHDIDPRNLAKQLHTLGFGDEAYKLVYFMWIDKKSEPFGWSHQKERFLETLVDEDWVHDIPETKPLRQEGRVKAWIEKAEYLSPLFIVTDLKGMIERASREMTFLFNKTPWASNSHFSPSSFSPEMRPYVIPVQLSSIGAELSYRLQDIRALHKTMKARAKISRQQGGG